MALSIRMARGGRKKRPFYKIVVADKRAPRDGRFIEKLGTYNPLLANDDEKRVVLNEERVSYWLGQGAQPSERVAIFLGKAGFAPMPKISERPNKSAPGAKALERIKEKEEKAAAAAEAAKEVVEEAAAAEEAPVEEEAVAPEAEAAEETPAEQAEAPTEEAPAAEDQPVEAEAPAEEAKEDAAEEAEPAAEAPAEEEEKKED